jgi:anti-anti-sigma factor
MAVDDPHRPTGSAAAAAHPGMRSGERLRITRGEQGEIVLAGEIDLATARTLRSALDEAAKDGSTLVVDLCEVLYLHSAGVAVLYDHAQGDLRLRVRPNTAVSAVIRICGLTHIAAVEFVPAPSD